MTNVEELKKIFIEELGYSEKDIYKKNKTATTFEIKSLDKTMIKVYAVYFDEEVRVQAQDRAQALDIDIDIDIDRDLVLDLVLDLDRAIDRALDLVLVLDRDLDLDRAIVLLDRALVLDLDRALVAYFKNYVKNYFEALIQAFQSSYSNTRYIVLNTTDGKSIFVFDTRTNKKIENWKTVLHKNNFLPSMSTIQLKSFDYLYQKHEKDDSFTFYLRTVNRAGRLDKGYFFLGNDDYCSISFWGGIDWKNKTASIYLETTKNGDIRLTLTAKDSEEKAIFLGEVAQLLGAKQLKSKGELAPTWIKEYSNEWERNYLEVLAEFVARDKEIIDAQIFKAQRKKSKNLGDIDFISTAEFQKNLERILPIREKIKTEEAESTGIQANISNKIKFKKISLKNIATFSSFEMDLSARVICIIGDNGTGKTNLLRAIVLGLVGINESTEIDPEKKQYKELQNILQIKGLDEHNNISYTGTGQIVLDYEMDKAYQNTIELKKIPNTQEVLLEEALRDDSFEALQDSNYFPQLVIAFTQSEGQDYDFKELESHRGNIRDVSSLLFSAKQNNLESFREWIFNLDGDKDKNPKNKKILDLVFEVVSGIIGKKMKLVTVGHQRGEIWVQVAEEKPILFGLISQGFTRVFLWIGHFIKRLSECNSNKEDFENAPAILIIDEIDTYLHPKWQRNILRFLAKKFTQTRFIVSTHSPLVASYIDRKEIEGGFALYRLNNEGSNPKSFTKTYGRDLAAIFYDWMQIPDRDPKVEEKIDTILNLIDEETKESIEQAKELSKELDLEEHDVIMSEIQSSLMYAEENLED